MRERGVGACVMEVSSHALAQHRVDGVVFDVAGFTNLSQDHLDFHADMEEYFAAKAPLFTPERCPPGGRLRRRRVGASGWPPRADRPRDHPDVRPRPARRRLARRRRRRRPPPTFVLARADGAELSAALRAARGLQRRQHRAGRLALIARRGSSRAAVERAIARRPACPGPDGAGRADGPDARAPLAVVDYAHTPDAVAAALRALRRARREPLVVVLGAGGDRDRGKRPVMGPRLPPRTPTSSSSPTTTRARRIPAAIRAAVLDGALGVRRGATAGRSTRPRAGERPIRTAVRVARRAGRRRSSLVAGKGHETGQDVAGVVHPFDDRVELRAALDAALASGPRPGPPPRTPDARRGEGR